jgi:hypothetical protein
MSSARPGGSLRAAKEGGAGTDYYGIDNQIDGVVLDVLLQAQDHTSSLGISVPVLMNTEQVRAILKGCCCAPSPASCRIFAGLDEFIKPQRRPVRQMGSASNGKNAAHPICPETLARK